METTKTAPYWTEEKHVQFLNTMEASFVRTMLHNNSHRCLLLLRHIPPDTSESTLDLKPHHHRNRRRRTLKHHELSVGPALRRTRRRSSILQPLISTEDQVVPQVENESGEVASLNCHHDDDKLAHN